MDCREFEKHHVAYVDDLLSAADMDAMDQHLAKCPRCARRNIAVRRSLLIVHSLPAIEPSPEFMARLSARLDALGPPAPVDRVGPIGHIGSRAPVSSVGAFVALAAGVAAVAYLAIETNNYFAVPRAQPAVVATAPEAPAAAPLATNAAIVASVSTGIPVWPAVLMVGQAPMRFASMELNESADTR